jgi:hypothetical protein
MLSKFAARLAELKKTFDVFPWLEVLKLGPAPDSGIATGGYSFLGANWKRPYSMLLREFRVLPFSIDDQVAALATVTVYDLPVDFLYEFGSAKQSSQPALVHAIVGSSEKGWHGFGDGLYIAKDRAISFDITTRGPVNNKGYVYLVGAGYRLYPKGTISPVQHTVEEYVHQGFRLTPFSYVKRIDIAATETVYPATMTFPEHFLLEGVRTSVRGFGDDDVQTPGLPAHIAANIEIKIDADRTMMTDPANRFVVAGHHKQNDWEFEEPITINGGTDWVLSVQIPRVAGVGQYAVAPSIAVEFVFHGHKIEKVK